MQVDKNCNATVTAPNNQVSTTRVNPSNGSKIRHFPLVHNFNISFEFRFVFAFAEDSPSQQLQLQQQQNAFRQKQNAQPLASENDPQNAVVTGTTSQSANPQQSQNSLNNSQQHQNVSFFSPWLDRSFQTKRILNSAEFFEFDFTA